jgi:hypothetical protein
MADAATDDARVIETLNKSFERGRNPSVKLLGGRIISYDRCGALVARPCTHHAVQPVCMPLSSGGCSRACAQCLAHPDPAGTDRLLHSNTCSACCIVAHTTRCKFCPRHAPTESCSAVQLVECHAESKPYLRYHALMVCCMATSAPCIYLLSTHAALWRTQRFRKSCKSICGWGDTRVLTANTRAPTHAARSYARTCAGPTRRCPWVRAALLLLPPSRAIGRCS